MVRVTGFSVPVLVWAEATPAPADQAG
jgi:hypothetical protein